MVVGGAAKGLGMSSLNDPSRIENEYGGWVDEGAQPMTAKGRCASNGQPENGVERRNEDEASRLMLFPKSVKRNANGGAGVPTADPTGRQLPGENEPFGWEGSIRHSHPMARRQEHFER